MSDRPVATDALATLGTIISENEKRDAIHIAVENVVAQQVLTAGDHVTAQGRLVNPMDEAAVGIVDPFLRDVVAPGQRFWLLIYPRKINSLRHVWSHPEFPDEPGTPGLAPVVVDPKEASIAWIKDYASNIDLGYNRLMAGADDWLASKKDSQWGDYLVDGGTLEGVSTDPEFWNHYATVREVEVPTEHRENFFSCSC